MWAYYKNYLLCDPPPSLPPLTSCDHYFSGGQRRLMSTDDNLRVEVVVSRFDEALNWIKSYYDHFHFTVYDKSPNVITGATSLPNVGRESHTYLHHIVSHYHSLADWTVFTQASEPSFGYKGHRSGGGHLNEGVTFTDYLHPRNHSLFVDTAAFFTFDDKEYESSLRMSYTYHDPMLSSKEMCPPIEGWSDWWDMGWFTRYVQNKTARQNGLPVTAFYHQLVRPEVPRSPKVELSFPQGARFAVSSKVIRSNPREYYMRLLETVSADKDPWAGYYLEWSWPSIFKRQLHSCPLPAHKEKPSSFVEAMRNMDLLYKKMKEKRPRGAEWSTCRPSPCTRPLLHPSIQSFRRIAYRSRQ